MHLQEFSLTQSVNVHTYAHIHTKAQSNQRATTFNEALWFGSGVLTAFALDPLKCILVAVTTCRSEASAANQSNNTITFFPPA